MSRGNLTWREGHASREGNEGDCELLRGDSHVLPLQGCFHRHSVCPSFTSERLCTLVTATVYFCSSDFRRNNTDYMVLCSFFKPGVLPFVSGRPSRTEI